MDRLSAARNVLPSEEIGCGDQAVVAFAPLPHAFYDRDTILVARELIGCVLCRMTADGILAGVIVETEAYGPDDPASHAFGGKTRRNAVMFGPPGRAYVYRSYGVHWCLNAVTAPEGAGEAVLIRALEPVCGAEAMSHNRGASSARVLDRRFLCGGPGRLCQALGITGALNGADLAGPDLWIAPGSGETKEVIASRRIGITRAMERPWRFTLAGSQHISRPVVRF